MTKLSKPAWHLLKDALLIVLSVVLAIALAKSGLIVKLFTVTGEMRIVGTLIAGFFFTSIFTTLPAIVALGELARTNSIWETAVIGAIGAMLGDFILFRFVRDKVAQDFLYLVQITHPRRLIHILHLRLFRWIIPFVGALIIASPLPDELGLMMLGLSRIKTINFIPLTLLFNFIGIVIIGLIARAI